MSHAQDHDPTVPKGALLAAAALLLFVMAMTGAVSMGLMPQEGNPQLSRAAAGIVPAEQRDLRVTDREDGAVVITDANSGVPVMVIGYGEGGFARATLRRLAKARALTNVGPEAPFRLTRWQNGALSLADPVTGNEAEIQGFGPDHTATFAAMLEDVPA